MGILDWLRGLDRQARSPSASSSTPGVDRTRRDPPEARPATSQFAATHPPPVVTEDEARRMVVGGLDFLEAIKAHQRWKGRLAAQLNGTSTERLDYRTVCRDDQCVLGKWINGTGAQMYGVMQAFSLLKVHHAQFHLAAGEIVRLHQEGRATEARDALRHGDYSRYSMKVQGLISSLYLEVKEGA